MTYLLLKAFRKTERGIMEAELSYMSEGIDSSDSLGVSISIYKSVSTRKYYHLLGQESKS